MEVPPGFEPGHNGFADRGLTTWLRYRAAEKSAYKKWSGLRGSNSLPPPWQGGALPDELNPHPGYAIAHPMVPPIGIEPTTRGFSVPCSTD